MTDAKTPETDQPWWRRKAILALAALGCVVVGVGGYLATSSGETPSGKSGSRAEGVRWTWVSERARQRRHRGVADGSGPAATREFPWPDYEILALDIPADVTFIQSDKAPATVRLSGPRGTVDQVLLHSGLLHFRDHVKNGGRLAIVVTAPRIERFELSGSNSLSIRDYHQERLQVDATGGAKVNAQGKAGVIELYVSGAAQADLSGLSVDGADVEAKSSGRAVISPARWAHLFVSDQGEVRLAREPSNIEAEVSDQGQVLKPGQAGTNRSATPLLQ